jgi:AhpC/TSA antioxidant enzyme
VQKHLDEIQQAGVEVLVITQSRPAAVALMSLPFPTLCDPERAAYRSFGLDRGKWSMFFRGSVLARYLGLIFAGWIPRGYEAGEDVLQLGGDFILAADRRLLYAHRSTDPADRPSANELVEQVQRIAASTVAKIG